MYPEQAVVTGFCSSPRRWRPGPAAECWSMLTLEYSELSWDHSASARTSTSPYRSKALLASPMHLVALVLTLADDYNHSARKPQPSRLLLPTLLGERQHFPRIRLCPVRTSGKCTPYRCIPKQFICAASGCKTTFIRQRCSRTWDCASPITGKLPILRLPLTGGS